MGCKTIAGSQAKINPDSMIGSVAQITSTKSVIVEGVGLVGGLNGKGSSECPVDVRKYLTQYILAQNPKIDADGLINSLNTAVVVIDGNMPVSDSSKPYFDLKVTAMRGTQTVSLEDGTLYLSELKRVGSFGINTAVLANAEGPVFIDEISDTPVDKRTGYILGGGKVIEKYAIGLVLGKDDYELTNIIRNKLNSRFGNDVARAIKAGLIEVITPSQYKFERAKFIELIKVTYVYDIPQNDQERINKNIRQLMEQPDSNEGEFALEAFGNQCLSQLSAVLKSPNEHVRLRAARCMLNLRSDDGFSVLKEIALNRLSPYRIEALKAVTEGGRSADTSSLCQELLKDDDFNIRLASYKELRKFDDPAVIGRIIASNFYLEKITQTNKRDIYVSRSGQPIVVLFGAPIFCNKGILVKSADGEITIDAQASEDYVTVSRKFPSRPDLTGQIRCSYELGNIIEALCENPPEKGRDSRGGLGVTYSDLIPLLKQMCDKSAVNAEFHAGPLPKIGLNVKK